MWIDWPTATTEVVTYLAGLGHRRIALVVPSRSDARVGNREDWYRPALARAGLGPERALVFRDAMSLEGGHAAGQRLLATEPRPTAAICHNDVMAIGLLQACAEHRLRVPEDLSIVGWDDVPYASLVTPPLTTVRVPRYELGQAAARKLLELMAGRPAGRGGAAAGSRARRAPELRAAGRRPVPSRDARPEAADPPAKGGARRARRRSSSGSWMVARPVETLSG